MAGLSPATCPWVFCFSVKAASAALRSGRDWKPLPSGAGASGTRSAAGRSPPACWTIWKRTIPAHPCSRWCRRWRNCPRSSGVTQERSGPNWRRRAGTCWTWGCGTLCSTTGCFAHGGWNCGATLPRTYSTRWPKRTGPRRYSRKPALKKFPKTVPGTPLGNAGVTCN